MKKTKLQNCPKWLLDANTINEDVEFVDGVLTWKNGTWKNGTWESGTWEDGVWEDGTWESGIWEDGVWEDGTWKDGTWESGTWEDGVWEDGVWEDGTWESGTWEDGVWEDGVWEDGTWKDGVWEGGIWWHGIWEGGKRKPMCKWSVYSTSVGVMIGCKEKTIKEWDDWFASDETFETQRNSEQFKNIRACYESVKAYKLIIES